MIRLFADENIPLASVRKLRSAGHTVISATETCAGEPDTVVLQRARDEDAVLITFDRDFGSLVYRHSERAPTPGIVLLRFIDTTPEAAADVVLSALRSPEIDLRGHFTVIERDHIRQRRLPTP